jgi:hypothetical protein
MKRPSTGLAVAVGGVSVGAASIAIVIAQLELSGQPQPHIWSNVWLLTALCLAGTGLLVAVVFFVMSIVGRGDAVESGDAPTSLGLPIQIISHEGVVTGDKYEVEGVSVGQRKDGPAITDRWRRTTDGQEAPALLRIGSGAPGFHPGYASRREEDKPPSVQIAVVIACAPLAARGITGTELRARFIALLESEPVRKLISALTSAAQGISWTERAGHGRVLLEAVVVHDPGDQHEVPAASAQLSLPESGTHRFGQDGRSAELVLYVEPRAADGKPPAPADLRAWHAILRKALTIPAAMAEFLSAELDLMPSNDPPAQFGVFLRSREPLTSIISVAELRMRPGASPMNWFYGYLVADADGDPADEVARELLTQLCEYTLQVNGYDQILATLGRVPEPGAEVRSSMGPA